MRPAKRRSITAGRCRALERRNDSKAGTAANANVGFVPKKSARKAQVVEELQGDRLQQFRETGTCQGRGCGFRASAFAGLKSGLRGIGSGALNPHGTLVHIELMASLGHHQQVRCV